jgi:hypothetical protein
MFEFSSKIAAAKPEASERSVTLSVVILLLLIMGFVSAGVYILISAFFS